MSFLDNRAIVDRRELVGQKHLEPHVRSAQASSHPWTQCPVAESADDFDPRDLAGARARWHSSLLASMIMGLASAPAPAPAPAPAFFFTFRSRMISSGWRHHVRA